MVGVCSGSNFQLDSNRNLVNCFDVLGSAVGPNMLLSSLLCMTMDDVLWIPV
ncbi:hypothetical protein KY285_027212 [Solanum tuberosum]|nr:hypothetical protein KY289_027422 [Solanum tuberosum]KAH0666006.1 hypothetical protein KY285_027212 [Solanum tuberosum]